jgi:hypothetical protein
MRDAPTWAPLLPVAMVGTDRQPGALPSWPGPVGAAIAALADVERDDGDRAAADVLRAAGILTLCGLAGARPQALATAPAGAAATDAAPAVDDPALLQWLAWTLQEGPDRLKQAFFQRLAQDGLRLPHALLPQALELARSSLAMRPLIQPLLGERGVWLARQREEWQFAVGVAAADEHNPRLWDEGTLEQRKAFLAAERARDPHAARERLVAALPELPAKERAELARGLAEGLAMADEPLLEQLRNDRGQDVRAVALELLLRLPDAAHPRRAAARVAALMSRGGLLAGRRWAIEPPAEAADDWKADQVDPDVPKGGMGQRAWWLYQLVRQVPLAWWTQHTGLDARALSAWALSTDWGDPLWRGWRDVLRRAPDTAWAELLLDDAKGAAGHGGGSVHGDREMALDLVSAEVRERWVVRQLASSEASLSSTIWSVASRCGPGDTISANLAAPIVERVRRTLALNTELAPGTHNANIVEQESVGRVLPDLCCALPLSFLADFEHWAASPNESAAIGRARHAGRQIIQARRALAHLPA